MEDIVWRCMNSFACNTYARSGLHDYYKMNDGRWRYGGQPTSVDGLRRIGVIQDDGRCRDPVWSALAYHACAVSVMLSKQSATAFGALESAEWASNRAADVQDHFLRSTI